MDIGDSNAPNVGDVRLVPTPSLLLDRGRLETNCQRMLARMEAPRPPSFRPHLKTAKSVPVAQLACGKSETLRGAVSTVEEVDYFVRAGVTDLTYAVGIVPHKLERLIEVRREADVGVITDQADVAEVIANRAPSQGAPLSVWLEIDSGGHRGGFHPGDRRLVDAGRILDASPGVRLRGVITHAGHSYACTSTAEIQRVAEQERSLAVKAATALRAARISVPEVSVGSTPTALFATSWEGVTEVRAGVHVFFDLFQESLGCCVRDELALSVVASVVALRPETASIWIDAGALGLSQDRSLDGAAGGYGEVVALDGHPLAGRPRVTTLHQVHGEVRASEGVLDPKSFRVGDRVRVFPNHACMTAAMYDEYLVHDGAGSVLARWERLRG